MMQTVVAFDPGVTGAMALMTCEGPLALHDLPTVAVSRGERAGHSFVQRRLDARGIAMLVRQACPRGTPLLAFCEHVQAFRTGPSSMQAEGSLMRSLGAIEAVCDILQAPAQLILPQHWQSFFGLVGKGVETRDRGELPASIRLARELYPQFAGELSLVKHHNRAEALLIAHYAQRQRVIE